MFDDDTYYKWMEYFELRAECSAKQQAILDELCKDLPKTPILIESTPSQKRGFFYNMHQPAPMILTIKDAENKFGLFQGPQVVSSFENEYEGKFILEHRKIQPKDIQDQIESYERTHPILAHHQDCKCFRCVK